MTTEDSTNPEFLVSQLTHTCLAVISSAAGDAEDAVIGMANCNGGIEQQWFNNGGQWQWAGDRTLCLSKDEESRRLCLKSCNSVTVSWILDQDGRFCLGSEALQVQQERPRDKVSLKSKNKHLNQKWWTLSQLKAIVGDDFLVGEHSLAPSVLEICQREMDRTSSERRKTNKISHKCPSVNRWRAMSDILVASCEGEVITDESTPTDPEYLISQNTLTCLTVFDDNGPNDAEIGLTPFDGGLNQQWFVNGGHWHWEGNRSYCLIANGKKNTLRLGVMNKRTTAWTFDESGLLKSKSKVLQVDPGEERSQVTLSHQNGGENQRWWKLSEVRYTLQVKPLSKTDYPETLLEMVKKMPCQSIGREDQCTDKDLACPSSNEDQHIIYEKQDYLINQSTHTCLSVSDSSSPDNAVISLIPYTGDPVQQWFVRDGTWYWAKEDSYYLAADLEDGCLHLASNTEINTVWTLDESGWFSVESLALDVHLEKDRTRVNLQPKKEGKTQKWWQLSKLISYIGRRLYPFPADDKNTYLQEVARGIINRLTPLSEPLPHPRDIGHYPGTVASATPRSNLFCTLKVGAIKQRHNVCMRAPQDWQATNMYVIAGNIVTIILPDTLTERQAEQITIRIGAQSDSLKPSLPKLKGKHFRRMPFVYEDFDVRPGINLLRSQYGGNLIFIYNGEESFEIIAVIQNVAETPHYILGETTEENWEKMRSLDTPFSVLEGNKVVLIVPTSGASSISNPAVLLHQYDDVIHKIEDLAGFSADDPPPQGKQWLVDDVQISYGNAHAGFPIMFQHQFNDLTSLETPYSWVIWHEIGHNYQQRKFWSRTYGIESSVNLFSLYVEEKVNKADRLRRENRYAPTADAVDNGLTFQRADCWQKLIFLMEIKHAFPNHGWEVYRHLNRVTRALSQEEAENLKSNLQNQYDYVYKTISRFINTDLIPHYQRWGLPVSQEAQDEIEDLGLPKAPENLSVFCPCDDHS